MSTYIQGTFIGYPTHAQYNHAYVVQYTVATTTGGILKYLDHSRGYWARVAVPFNLLKNLMQETHGGNYRDHFTGPKLYNTLSSLQWWPGMY